MATKYDYYMKRNDTYPPLPATLTETVDSVTEPVDLTGNTVKCIIKVYGKATVKVNAAATVDPDQTANKGKVLYNWVVGDTDTDGVYEVEFERVLPDGRRATHPNTDIKKTLLISKDSA